MNKTPGGTELADSGGKKEKVGTDDSPEKTTNQTRKGAFPGK